MWREDRPQWTVEHELLATIPEVFDAWSRQIHIALARLGGAKQDPRYGPPLRIQHPNRAGAKPTPPPTKRVSFHELPTGAPGR